MTIYILEIIDRRTKKVVQTETRRTQQSFDRLWCKALSNINPLTYKLSASEKPGEQKC